MHKSQKNALKSILWMKNGAKLSYFFHSSHIFLTFAYQKITSTMKIGDKVRFLNEVGGGKITAFRPGGIVLVEDADGFEMPVHQNEVVVIQEAPSKAEKKAASSKEEKFEAKKGEKPEPKKAEKPEPDTLNGKEYLKSKTVAPADEEPDKAQETVMDEQLEARIVRLEMTIQKLEARITRLEAENNLRKNEKLMTQQAKTKRTPTPDKPTTLGDLDIL